MTSAKLSSKNQIVIPKDARNKIGIQAGDELIVLVREDRIELVPRPKNYTHATLGLGRDVWKGIDAVDYVRGERREWKKKRRP